MGECNFFERPLDAERDAFLMAFDDSGNMVCIQSLYMLCKLVR